LTFGSLFSGIGVMDLGLERAGMTCKWQVENNDYCLKVLSKHWPDIPKYSDITTLDFAAVEPVDLLAGGFPCQDLSVAGKREGLREGNRSGLWFEFLRGIRTLRPRFVLVENVPGLLINHAMGRVLGDLAECGYNAEWTVLAASAFGAPHARERVFIIAYTKGIYAKTAIKTRITKKGDGFAHDNGKTGDQYIFTGKVPTYPWQNSEPRLCGVHDGLPSDVDRLKGLGNACVPQCVEWIGRQIKERHE
jgi:DNA (cytosine-5)-methyltransferase 1